MRDKLSVSVIGAGRVGTALALALKESGHSIELMVGKHATSVKRASRLVGGKTVGLSAHQFRRLNPVHRDLLRRNSLIIISTPDDVMASVAEDVASLLSSSAPPAKPRNTVVLHTSGALSSAILKPLKQYEFAIGSLHPLVSISDSTSSVEWLSRAFYAVEGDRLAIRTAKRIVREFGGQSFKINAQAKALYHAAALMASPNVTALFDIALEMLIQCGLTRTRAREVLLPLVESTVSNFSTQDPSLALTGTFKRGDVATVRKHIHAISSQGLVDALEAYLLLGRHSVKLAGVKSGKRNAEIDRILARASKPRGSGS